MNGAIQFGVGAVATSLLAIAFHGPLGKGATFIDALESRARSTLGDAGGVGISVAFVRTPALERVAILSGSADPATRTRLLAAIRALPGVRDARWAEGQASTGSGE